MAFTDIHCHILPAVDDGSQSLEETMEMLRIAEAEGIRRMIVTPHYKAGHRSPNEAKIMERVAMVQETIEKEGLHITLYPGNEIYYTSELEEKLEQKKAITMNHTDYLLVEFSPMEHFTYIRNAMNDILGLGYTPILAHVERYQCMLRDVENVEQLRSLGCFIQVNASSVTGGNGFKCKKFVHKLLKQNDVDFIGTDAHNTIKRKPEMKKCADLISRKYGKKYSKALMGGNAEEMLLS